MLLFFPFVCLQSISHLLRLFIFYDSYYPVFKELLKKLDVKTGLRKRILQEPVKIFRRVYMKKKTKITKILKETISNQKNTTKISKIFQKCLTESKKKNKINKKIGSWKNKLNVLYPLVGVLRLGLSNSY